MRGNEKKQDESIVMVISEDILSARSITCSIISHVRWSRRKIEQIQEEYGTSHAYQFHFSVITLYFSSDSSSRRHPLRLQPLCFGNLLFLLDSDDDIPLLQAFIFINVIHCQAHEILFLLPAAESKIIKKKPNWSVSQRHKVVRSKMNLLLIHWTLSSVVSNVTSGIRLSRFVFSTCFSKVEKDDEK